MDDLIFTAHALIEMARDHITADGVYHVIGDADEIFERTDGRTEYIGKWDRRTFMVLTVNDEVVITAFELKRLRPRRMR